MTIYIGSKHLKYLKYCLEEDLPSLHDWFNANKLTLNVSKTVGVLFSPNKGGNKLKIVLNSIEIPILEFTKFLGTWVDQNLNWKTHVDKLALRINSRNGLLKRGKRILGQHAQKVLYYAQIHSIIQYGIVIWGNMKNKSQIKKLQKLQNASVRQIDYKKHTDEIYKEYQIPRIEQLIKIENAKIWHKQQINRLPLQLQTVMTFDHSNMDLHRQHNYHTRNKKIPRQPIAKNSQYQKSLFIKGLSDYASLPPDLRKIMSWKLFCRKTKDFVLKSNP